MLRCSLITPCITCLTSGYVGKDIKSRMEYNVEMESGFIGFAF